MYDFKVIDDAIPYEIRRAAYVHIQVQRWYTGYRELPQLDRLPYRTKLFDVSPPPVHHSISRAPFASKPEHLDMHQPIKDLFNYINEHVFDGKLELNGLHEPSPGLNYRAKNYKFGDCQLSASTPFLQRDKPWTREILDDGSIAYMQAQPYETMRQTRVPHRDWKSGQGLDDNVENYSTLMYVANMEWKPEWYGEFTLFEDAPEDIAGVDKDNLPRNRGVPVGWPVHMIDNVPGRIVVQDGRQLHATRAVGEQAPELAMHINFRVSIKD